MKTRFLTAAIVFAGAAASADQVLLLGGGVVRGEVVERRADAIVLEVGPGRMTLPMSRVLRVVDSDSALQAYRDRAGRLRDDDLEGWLALAAWARDNDLGTQARTAFEHVLALEPQNAAAHEALGHVRHAGRWVPREDAYRAQGLVFFEGEWLDAAARGAILAARVTEAQARSATLEADARVREAEARAREAESAARAAEARHAEAAAAAYGLPYPYGYGGYGGPLVYGGIYEGPHGTRRAGRHGHPRHPGDHPAPPVVQRVIPASDAAASRPRPPRSSAALPSEGNR